VFTAALGVLAFWGTARFGSTWMPVGLAPFDDEGYLMISVKGVLAGKPLYDEVYSQYGPFYYVVQAIVHRLFGLPLTHDVTRQLLLADWLAAAALTGWVVCRLTRSGGWAVLTFLAVAGYLYRIGAAPGHPQEIILISMSAVLLLTTALRSDGAQWALTFALGALAAAVTFTKINVGTFLVVGLGLALLCAARRVTSIRRAFRLGFVIAVTLPAVVMRDHLPDAMTNVLGASLAIGSCALAAWHHALDNRLPARTLLRTAVAFAATAAALCAVTLMSGTSLGGLIDGVVLQPSRFAELLWFLNPYPVGAVVAGLCSLLLCFMLLIHPISHGPTLRSSVAVARFLYGVLVLWCVCLYRRYELLWYATPFAWLVLLPVDDERAGGSSVGRATLALVGALQSLTAYPIRGTQLNCATYLLIAASAVCLADAVQQLVPAMVMRRLIATAAATLALVGAYRGVLPGLRVPFAPPVTPLGLRGADRLQVPRQEAAKLRWITETLRAHCDTFVTEPGLNSYYFWTGLDPPTGLNAGMWMVLLDEGQQQRIVDALVGSQRPCAVRDQALASWWNGATSIPKPERDARPLARHLDEEFVTVSSVGGLELLLPKNRDSSRFEDYLLWGEALLDGTRVLPVPAELLTAAGDRTLTAWFRTTTPGVVLACQSSAALGVPAGTFPILYVDRDGKLAGELDPLAHNVVVSPRAINDGAWHQAVLVLSAGSQALYMDGELLGSLPRSPVSPAARACAIGAGNTSGWPAAGGGWTWFRGAVADVSVAGRARSAEEIRRDHREGRQRRTFVAD